MQSITVKELTEKSFRGFGSFYNVLNPTGHNLGDFYHDHVLFPVLGGQAVGFSSLLCHSPEEMIVSAAEYHNYTAEILLSLDGDVIIHVAPPSKEAVSHLTEAFLVPKGTLVKLHTGVWHLAPFSIRKEITHVLIALPERTYMNDCVVVEYPEDQQIRIQCNSK